MTPVAPNKKMYAEARALGLSSECALNLVLVDMELKDATTIGYAPGLAAFLKKWKFIHELDVSYLAKRIHGFVENTTSVRVPGAEVVRRYYVGKRIRKQFLSQLRGGSNYTQGLLFGFPMCCVTHFCRKAVKEGKGYIEVFQDFIRSMPVKNGVRTLDYRLMGGFVKYFDAIRVTEYIPCSPACAPTLALVDRNRGVLGAVDPAAGAFLDASFRESFLLYGTQWESIGLIKIAALRGRGGRKYSGRCIDSLPRIIGPGTDLSITLEPFKSLKILCAGKTILHSCASRGLPWSYCFVKPVVVPSD